MKPSVRSSCKALLGAFMFIVAMIAYASYWSGFFLILAVAGVCTLFVFAGEASERREQERRDAARQRRLTTEEFIP